MLRRYYYRIQCARSEHGKTRCRQYGRSLGIVYCCRTADEASEVESGLFVFMSFAGKQRTDERTRTADLFITSELLARSQLFVEVHKRLEQGRFGLLTYRGCLRLFAWAVVKTVVISFYLGRRC